MPPRDRKYTKIGRKINQPMVQRVGWVVSFVLHQIAYVNWVPKTISPSCLTRSPNSICGAVEIVVRAFHLPSDHQKGACLKNKLACVCVDVEWQKVKSINTGTLLGVHKRSQTSEQSGILLITASGSLDWETRCYVVSPSGGKWMGGLDKRVASLFLASSRFHSGLI